MKIVTRTLALVHVSNYEANVVCGVVKVGSISYVDGQEVFFPGRYGQFTIGEMEQIMALMRMRRLDLEYGS